MTEREITDRCRAKGPFLATKPQDWQGPLSTCVRYFDAASGASGASGRERARWARVGRTASRASGARERFYATPLTMASATRMPSAAALMMPPA